jgi:hypothetical protein
MLSLPGKDLSRGLSCFRLVYIPLRSRPPFLWSDGSPLNLTAPQVNFNMRDLLSRAGVPGYFSAVSDRRSNSRECRIT